MAHNPTEISEEVEEAMETVFHPGSWEDRDGEIFIGIDGNFNGYELTAGTVRDQLEAWQVLARHYGVTSK